MSDNWIVQNLENALETWNAKLSEIWMLITQSPETFKGGAMDNRVISSDDPNAIQKLQDKLEMCEKSQKYMKEVNAYYRKNGTCEGFPGMEAARAARLDESVRQAYSWDKQPFPSYALTNNSAEIRRLKQRIEKLTVNQEVGFVGWTFDGGEVVANSEENRLQILFDEKPDEQKRSALKGNGFKWSPSQGAWQRQLNDNAIYAASRSNEPS